MQQTIGLKIKRALDFTAAAFLLILLSPLLALIALMVWYNFGWPIIFSDPRVGQHATIYKAHKFRSMSNATGDDGKFLPDAQRMTRFSKILRASSLDELPQLWNVLVGEMSLIGPRPIITAYLPYVRGDELRRLDMPPGITGLSQVNGRNSLDWDSRLEMDVWYVNNWSLWLDIKIAFKTIPVWLMAQGVTTPGHVSSARLDDVRRHEVRHQPAAAPVLDESRASTEMLQDG